MLAGVLVRSAGGPALVVAGTVLIGVAITVGNIAVPLIIRRDFAPRRQGTAMGDLHRSVEHRLVPDLGGHGARWLSWHRVAACAGRRGRPGRGRHCGVDPGGGAAHGIHCRRAAGQRRGQAPGPVAVPAGSPSGLTAGFGGQAFSYYGVTAWLPSYLHDELGMSAAEAGAASSIFQILAIVGGLGVPFAAKYMSTTAVAVTLGALWTAVPAGLLLACRSCGGCGPSPVASPRAAASP